MSGTVCCYSGCKRSYSADKDVSFFAFPGDPKRRKKWMDSIGNTELKDMDERQLRRKRVCSDHFISKAFSRPESRTALNDSAVPIPAKKPRTSTPVPIKTPAAGTSSTPKSSEEPKKATPRLSKRNSKPDPPTTTASETESSKEVSQNSEKTVEEPPEPEKIQTPVSTPKGSPKKVTKTTRSTPKPDPASEAESTKPETSSAESPKVVLEVDKPEGSSSEAPKVVKEAAKPEGSNSEAPIVAKKSTPEGAGSETPIVAKKSTPEGAGSEGPKVLKKVVKPKGSSSEAPKVLKKIVKPEGSSSEPPKVLKKVVKPEGSSSEAPKVLKKVVKPEGAVAEALKILKKVPKSVASSSETPKVIKKVAKPDEGSGSEAPKVLKKIAKPEGSSSEAPKVIKKVVKAVGSSSEASKVLKKVSNPEGTTSEAPKVLKKVAKPEGSSSEAPKVLKKVAKPEGSSSEAPKVLKKVAKPEGSSSETPKLLKKVTKDGSGPKLPFYPEACSEVASLEYQQGPDESLFEGFYVSLKRYLKLSGRWTIGGVQWDPQGKRKVIMVSEPEISPNGRPCVKRCLQFFEDKELRVFIDGLDMTDVFKMKAYSDKEDVAALICRVSEASSCGGVPEMISEDLPNFPTAKKRSTSFFDADCPGVIPNESYESICSACKILRLLVLENRQLEKKRLTERRIRSQEKEFRHPFGEALYTMFSDLVDETDPTKPRKKRTKETFFRKFLTDTRYKMNGEAGRTERIYVEKPISVDSVSASFQDIVSKLGFSMPNAQKKPSGPGSAGPRPSTSLSTPRPRIPGTSGLVKIERKTPMQTEHIFPFTPGSSFTFDDGQEYELIGEVEPGSTDFVEVKPNTNQYEIIEVDEETMTKLSLNKNQVVVLPEAAASSSSSNITRIDVNDPNLSQILKAINTSQSQGFKVT